MLLFIFFVLSAGLLASAIMVIYQESPVHSALFLIIAFLFLGGFYLLLGAEFIAAVHVIVYAGAIMVLFLFVIMLLNLHGDVRGFIAGSGKKIIAFLLCGLLLFFLLSMILPGIVDVSSSSSPVRQSRLADEDPGNMQAVGMLLYSKYILPFEIASILLLVAMIGAVVLAKQELR